MVAALASWAWRPWRTPKEKDALLPPEVHLRRKRPRIHYGRAGRLARSPVSMQKPFDGVRNGCSAGRRSRPTLPSRKSPSLSANYTFVTACYTLFPDSK